MTYQRTKILNLNNLNRMYKCIETNIHGYPLLYRQGHFSVTVKILIPATFLLQYFSQALVTLLVCITFADYTSPLEVQAICRYSLSACIVYCTNSSFGEHAVPALAVTHLFKLSSIHSSLKNTIQVNILTHLINMKVQLLN